MRLLVALALLPMLAGPALASPIHCPVRSRAVKVVEKVIDPVAVYVPSYTAVLAIPSYPPPPAPVPPALPAYPPQPAVAAPVYTPAYPAAAAPSACHRDIALALKPIMDRLAVIEAGKPVAAPVAPGAPVAQPPTGAAVPANPAVNAQAMPAAFGKCQACHSDGGAKGGGFTMFSGGNLAPLSDRQLRLIAAKAYSGAMPPKGQGQPLTDAEVGEIMAWVSSQK